MFINFVRSRAQSQVSIDFPCTVLEFKILAIPDVLAHWKSYEQRFHKKNVMVINFARSHAQSRVLSGFLCTVSKIQNSGNSQRNSPWEVVRGRVEFRSVFRLSSRKFKILAIPDILAHESSFDRFFMHHLRNSKYCHSRRINPCLKSLSVVEKIGSHANKVSLKNTMVINFARSRAQGRVWIGFSCIVSKIQNSGHSQRNSPWEVVRARFRKITRWSYTLREVARRSGVSIDFLCTISKIENTGHSRRISPWEVIRA
ncbi:hypothetical protein GW17_00054995 [Ensete ventricosum]|nr:hypothetical protein GW17_00054995 [Ensete ventricosum]RZS18081.1 hypothetical protein BHM03_00050299 [Ensete ventricosum]